MFSLVNHRGIRASKLPQPRRLKAQKKLLKKKRKQRRRQLRRQATCRASTGFLLGREGELLATGKKPRILWFLLSFFFFKLGESSGVDRIWNWPKP